MEEKDETMKQKTCEICGDVVTQPTKACCGHLTNLCRTCKKECPGALHACSKCEEKGL